MNVQKKASYGYALMIGTSFLGGLYHGLTEDSAERKQYIDAILLLGAPTLSALIAEGQSFLHREDLKLALNLYSKQIKEGQGVGHDFVEKPLNLLNSNETEDFNTSKEDLEERLKRAPQPAIAAIITGGVAGCASAAGYGLGKVTDLVVEYLNQQHL